MVEFSKDEGFVQLVPIGGSVMVRRFVVSLAAIAVLAGAALVPITNSVQVASAHKIYECKEQWVYMGHKKIARATVCDCVPHEHDGSGDSGGELTGG